MVRNIFLLIFLIAFNSIIYAQNEIENKIKTAYELINEKKIDLAYILIEEITKIYIKDTIRYESLKTDIFIINIFVESKKKNYEKAIYYLLKLEPISSEKDLPLVYRNLSSLYSNIGDIKMSIYYNEKRAIILKKVYGGKNPQYIETMTKIGYDYLKLNDYQKAGNILSEVALFQKGNFGENNSEYLNLMSDLGNSYYKLNKFEDAEFIFLSVINNIKIVFGEDSKIYINNLIKLAHTFTQLKKFQKAHELYLLVAEKHKNLGGDTHPDYLISLESIAYSYKDLGLYDKNLDIYKLLAVNKRKAFGDDHSEYLLGLNELAKAHSDFGQYKEAIRILEEVSEKQKLLFGSNDLNYLESLNNLANDYDKIGKNEEALQLYIFVSDKRKELLGENDGRYLVSQNNLASVYLSLGNYEKSLEILTEVIEKQKELFGETGPDYLMSLNNLAVTYIGLGNYKRALELHLIVASARKDVLGVMHLDYFQSINNIAATYSDLGLNDKAIEILSNLADVQEKSLGKNHLQYHFTCHNLAKLLLSSGKYQNALELCLQTLEFIELNYGKSHEVYLQSLSLFARILSFMKDYPAAISTQEDVVLTKKKLYGENNSIYLSALSNLGLLYSDANQYEKASEIYLRVTKLMQNILGKNHPEYIISISNMASLLDKTGKESSANRLFKEVIEFNVNYHKSNIEIMTEQEIENLVDIYSKIEYYNSFAKRNYYNFDDTGNDSYFLSLNTKGLALNSTINLRSRISRSKDSVLLAKYDEWIRNKRILARQSLLPVADRNETFVSLVEKANTLERFLIQKSSYISEIKKSIKVQDVRQHLRENEVVIEFISYRYHDKYRWTDSIYYAAIVLRKSDTSAIYIPLCEEKQIESMLSQKSIRESNRINQLYKKQELYNLIFKPLLQLIPKGSIINYAPSGVLHQINFDAIMNSDSTYLSDTYKFQMVSTTGKLVYPKPEKSPSSITVFGGLQYDMDEEEISNQIYRKSPKSNLVTRSYFDVDNTLRTKCSYLPGTHKEATDIINLSKNKNIIIQSFIGSQGIEENFKLLGDNESPSIIHVATHGFFFPDPKKDNKKLNHEMAGYNRFVNSSNNLNRSGLLFAGCNIAWNGDTITTNREDGILTAYEVSNLSLFNTELVVLSACETGLGDIKGSEGVYGLQRAFKMAGARYLMMSLWKVPDNATQEFMTTFYTELLTNKKSIREAYNTTQKQMRDKYRDEPYKWAGFVLME